MADTTTETTEEVVDQGKQVSGDAARWQDDFKDEELNIPYKREEEDEGSDNGDKSDTDKSADNATTKSTGNDDEDTEETTHSDPAPVVTAENPGDYSPADYSFEVTLKGGKTVTVKTPEDAEKLADDPDNFETPKQLMDFINKQNKMNRSLDKDLEKWESEKKIYDDQTATEKQRQDTIDSYSKEFDYLTKKGLLPKVDAQFLAADWSDPEVAKQAGVKEQIELLSYMVKENKVRAKAGVKPLTSIVDTYNAWSADNERKQAVKASKEAGEQRKAAGARVAGVASSAQQPYVPKGIAVGRVMSGRSASVWED